MIYDLIIVGAGPAGVSAAIYAARQKLNILMLSKDIGGQVGKKAVDIENYLGFGKISGPNLVKIFEEQLEKNQIKIVLDEVLKIENNNGKFTLHTESGKIYDESALFLSNYVNKIYILEFGKEIKADKENQELLAKTGKTEIITSAKILKIEGDAFVSSLTYQDLMNNQEKKLDLDGVFVEIGYSPATAFAESLVEFNDKDEIIADRETYQTKTPGLFAAGDCNAGRYKQIVIAAAEGAKAALASYEYLQKIKQ
ncbi:MAG: alkyl hydroperoxide reductase subunit F [Parcubacteria group bacterium Licking1014_1]|nr:MAG: alkyl hydroperoxide reductase subunit F [Parcubacteria group bacterium Licking1014_1]